MLKKTGKADQLSRLKNMVIKCLHVNITPNVDIGPLKWAQVILDFSSLHT